MSLRNIVKNILLKLSPSYQTLKRVEEQLKQSNELLKDIKNSDILQGGGDPIEDGGVYIREYAYTPKHRKTLENSKIGNILEEWYLTNKNEITSLMQRFCSFSDSYKKIPLKSSTELSPQWINDWIPPLDAISIYAFLAINNPRYYIEVGSGNTTMFAAQSIQDNNLRTRIISIDPFPRAGIDTLCNNIYRIPFENMDLDFFDILSSEDIFLLDNSHRSFPNSDVTVFFTEILPKLPSGVLYAMHDIFLPRDYPEQWSSIEKRWYNEQYLLCAYILGGANGDRIISPNAFLGSKKELLEIYNPLWGNGELLETMDFGGGFFWLKKA